MSGISTVLGGHNDRPTGQFGPDYAEKRRRIGPGGRFCHSNNTLQDEDSAGAAEAAHSCCHPAFHPMLDLVILLCLPLATQQWKRKKKTQAGLTRRHPVAAKISAKPGILNERRV